MPVIFTKGAIQAIRAAPSGTTAEGISTQWVGGLVPGGYAAMYRTQPNVRICVDFLARNIGQIGLHVYERDDTTNGRNRDRTGGLAQLLGHPNPQTSPSRLIAGTVADLSIFGHAFWVKIGRPSQRKALWRVPPTTISVEGPSMLGPDGYIWQNESGAWMLRPEDVLHFRFYDPDSEWGGCSPLETLRRTLAEERAASDHRLALWRNGARIAGVIERPKESGNWSDAARDKFRQQWEEKYSGPARSGRVAILEDGMSWKQAAYSMADTEANKTRQLNIEEVARVYQIPLPMVGILEHATFSNVREQHKQLYQDCLAPITVQLEDEVNLGLLPEYHDPDAFYTEFNISEKLKGSFEEQARAIQLLVGGPVMTRNEGRARLNLPAVEGGDELLQPLNTATQSQQGGGSADADAATEKIAAAVAAELVARRPTWMPKAS